MKLIELSDLQTVYLNVQARFVDNQIEVLKKNIFEDVLHHKRNIKHFMLRQNLRLFVMVWIKLSCLLFWILRINFLPK